MFISGYNQAARRHPKAPACDASDRSVPVQFTDERRTDDQGPVSMSGNRPCDLLLHQQPDRI
jgi:hypothetical protein